MKALHHDAVVGPVLDDVVSQLCEAIAGASRDVLEANDVSLAVAPEHTGADLSFACYPMARAWQTNPIHIARDLAAELSSHELLADARAEGPYLNLALERSALASRIFETTDDADYGRSERQASDKVMVEYVSPNTNKPLHLGHVRNAVLGRAVANLIGAQGAEVIKTDIINDRGIHIAKSMVAYRRWGKGETPDGSGTKGDHLVGRFYVEFDRALVAERREWLGGQEGEPATGERQRKAQEARFLEASELMAEARDVLQRWEDEDAEIRDLWQRMNGWVYEGFDATYDRLGIDFDKHYYESDIYQGGRDTILEAVERGVFERADNGAIVAPLSKHGKLQDKVVLRADGTGLYITQDINLAKLKFEEFGLDRSLYCIGSEQKFYMQQLIATLELVGFPWAKDLVHLSYGMVYLPDGKMKSREGKVVDADDLMAEMAKLAREAVAERSPEVEDAELERRGEIIGLAALTFHLLAVGRETDIQFDPQSSLAFEGKTGPYLLYTYARIASILRRAGAWQVPEVAEVETDAEWRVLLGLLLYPSEVADAAESYDPSRLTTYLFELAQTFNTFYHDHRVLDAEEPVRSSRLALLRGLRTVLGGGLRLLGIEPLDEM